MSSSQRLEVCAVTNSIFVGETGACVDIEPLLSLQSEEGSSWPDFESGGLSLGSPLNPWP